MTERELPPLEKWADDASAIFWLTFGVLTIVNLLETIGVLSEEPGDVRLWVSRVVAVVSIAAGLAWAAGAWRRRHRPRPPDAAGAERPPA